MTVDAGGRIGTVGQLGAVAGAGRAPAPAAVVDIRPRVVMPGLVDLHVHLPQVPSPGSVRGSTSCPGWSDTCSRGSRSSTPKPRSTSRRSCSVPWRTRARPRPSSTAPIWEPSLDAAFRAAEAHGIRAVIGKVMMDRAHLRRGRSPDAEVLETQPAPVAPTCASAGTAATTAGCSTRSRRGSRSAARPRCCASRPPWRARPARTGRPTCPRTAARSRRSGGCSRRRIDYMDVYDRAGGARPSGRSWPTPSTCRIGSSTRLVETRDAHRPLPGVEPVPGERRHAAGALPRARRHRRPRVATSPAGPTSRSSARCGSAPTRRTRCGS